MSFISRRARQVDLGLCALEGPMFAAEGHQGRTPFAPLLGGSPLGSSPVYHVLKAAI